MAPARIARHALGMAIILALGASTALADVMTTSDGVVHDPVWVQRINATPGGAATFDILRGSHDDWEAEEFPVSHTWIQRIVFSDPVTGEEGRQVDLRLKNGQEFTMATLREYSDGAFQIAPAGQEQAYPVPLATLREIYLAEPPEPDTGQYERSALERLDFNLEATTWAGMNEEFVQKNAGVLNEIAGKQVVPVGPQQEETFAGALLGWLKEQAVAISVLLLVILLVVVWRVVRAQAIDREAATSGGRREA